MSRLDEVNARLAELTADPFIPQGEDGYTDPITSGAINSEIAELEGEKRGLEAT